MIVAVPSRSSSPRPTSSWVVNSRNHGDGDVDFRPPQSPGNSSAATVTAAATATSLVVSSLVSTTQVVQYRQASLASSDSHGLHSSSASSVNKASSSLPSSAASTSPQPEQPGQPTLNSTDRVVHQEDTTNNDVFNGNNNSATRHDVDLDLDLLDLDRRATSPFEPSPSSISSSSSSVRSSTPPAAASSTQESPIISINRNEKSPSATMALLSIGSRFATSSSSSSTTLPHYLSLTGTIASQFSILPSSSMSSSSYTNDDSLTPFGGLIGVDEETANAIREALRDAYLEAEVERNRGRVRQYHLATIEFVQSDGFCDIIPVGLEGICDTLHYIIWKRAKSNESTDSYHALSCGPIFGRNEGMTWTRKNMAANGKAVTGKVRLVDLGDEIFTIKHTNSNGNPRSHSHSHRFETTVPGGSGSDRVGVIMEFHSHVHTGGPPGMGNSNDETAQPISDLFAAMSGVGSQDLWRGYNDWWKFLGILVQVLMVLEVVQHQEREQPPVPEREKMLSMLMGLFSQMIAVGMDPENINGYDDFVRLAESPIWEPSGGIGTVHDADEGDERIESPSEVTSSDNSTSAPPPMAESTGARTCWFEWSRRMSATKESCTNCLGLYAENDKLQILRCKHGFRAEINDLIGRSWNGIADLMNAFERATGPQEFQRATGRGGSGGNGGGSGSAGSREGNWRNGPGVPLSMSSNIFLIWDDMDGV
ncbi:hypothetical protein HDU76_013393 [Blyttiomyces sp. JEL0837]|nr:hypothetical protein HDU76_013393 [Blyttiomyces sp. JEL0837]